MTNYRLKNLFAKTFMQIALVAFIVFLAFPLVWLLSTSLKPNPETLNVFKTESGDLFQDTDLDSQSADLGPL